MQVVRNIRSNIYETPIIIFKYFPPRNSLISKISYPGNFFNKLDITHTTMIEIIEI